MNPNQLPEKPLIASLNTKNSELSVNTVYFIQRPTGDVIYVDEKSAWSLLKDRSMKLYGVGDGKTFNKGVMEARILGQTDIKLAQERLRKAVQEEMDSAKGKLIYPRNFDTVDFGGNPTIIPR